MCVWSTMNESCPPSNLCHRNTPTWLTCQRGAGRTAKQLLVHTKDNSVQTEKLLSIVSKFLIALEQLLNFSKHNTQMGSTLENKGI